MTINKARWSGLLLLLSLTATSVFMITYASGLDSIVPHPDPDQSMTFNGHTYMWPSTQLSWTDAKAWCEARGGHLLTINFREEADFVVTIVPSEVYAIWIGLKRGDTSWITGEPLVYTAWFTDRPDADPDNDYVNMTNLFPDNNWENRSNAPNHFICEWDNGTVTTPAPTPTPAPEPNSGTNPPTTGPNPVPTNTPPPTAPSTPTPTPTPTIINCVLVDTVLPAGEVGKPYDYKFTATGNGGYMWRLGGTLPDGLFFSTNGAIYGTPTQADSAAFMVTVSDSAGKSDQRGFVLIVTGTPVITPTPTPLPEPPTTLPPPEIVVPKLDYSDDEDISIDVTIDTGQTLYDVYVVFVLPEGFGFVCMDESANFGGTNQVVAAFKSWKPVAGKYSIFKKKVSKNWLRGKYDFYVILVKAGDDPTKTANWASFKTLNFNLR